MSIANWRAVGRLVADTHHDFRFGARLIVRGPAFSAVAIVTLAIAIGANTAVFSVLNALLFTPLPIVSASEVMRIRPGESTMSWPNYQDVRARARVFAEMAAHRNMAAALTLGDRQARLTGEATSANYFTMLGVSAGVGRTYGEADSRSDVAVLAHHVWSTRFAADPGVIGRPVLLGGRSYQVIGVMPPQFRGVRPPGLRPDFWVPVDASASSGLTNDRMRPQFEIIGRLGRGASAAQAAAELRVVGQQLRAEHPQLEERFSAMEVFSVEGFGAFSGMSGLLLPILAFLSLLIVVTVCVLFIACANIASVLVGRGASRRREIAVRLAVGASAGRVVRQLFTEGLTLAFLGALGGVLLARWLTQLSNLAASRLPFTFALDVPLDHRILLYTAAVTVVATIVFALSPARRAARLDLVPALKDDSVASFHRQRLLRALVIGQVAACTMLLFWSGLFFRSLTRIADVDPGFNPSGVLLATVRLEPGTFEDERGERLLLELQRRINGMASVESTGLASIVPLALMGREEFYVTTDDDRRLRQRVNANRLTPGWFRTLQIPFTAGRDFTADDRAGAPRVVIVNETLARQAWGGRAVGQRVTYGGRSHEVVGIVRDSKYATLGETIAPTIYQPFSQAYFPEMTLHVRTTDAAGMRAGIERVLSELAPEAAADITPMRDAVAVAVLPARVGAIAIGALALVAVLLALLGVYGLVSYFAVERTREIGLRKALGAQSGDIVRMILGSTARVTAVGLTIGVVAGTLGGFAIRGFIFGVSPVDGVTLSAVVTIVALVALGASLLPVRRSVRMDPLLALRNAD
jgi:putative ABC transport system permease protein